MSKGNLNETVSVSFHYFEKGVRKDEGEFEPVAFTKGEFDALVEKIESQPEPDLSVANDFDGVKFGRVVPFTLVKKVNERTVFGMFRSAYWGHSYENSEKGKIEADSLNLRDFCFILYLSESGHIFLGCQYLGNYGDYTSLSRTILRHLGLGPNVRSCSIHSDAEDFKNTIPTEVKVTLSGQGKALTDGNVFSKGSMVAFKKEGQDDTFEVTVRDKLLSLVGQPQAEIKKQVAALLNKNELFSVDDTDIQNCVVTVRRKKSKGTKTVYLFGQPTRATRFQIDVKLNDDGHPVTESARTKMLEKLQDEIISKVMDD